MTDARVIVGLGETLWDIFPDGARLGGAPLNFACSVAGLAKADAHVFMASSVGNDELGQRAVESLGLHGVSTDCLQITDRPTGRVMVELNSAGVAAYRFAEDAAWDHLSWSSTVEQLASNCDAVCFGTLGQRSERSKTMIQRFVAETSNDALRILDVNLRAPFFCDEILRESLLLANVLKLNDEELPVVARLGDVRGSDLEMMRQLAERFQLRCIAVTRGANGAMLLCGEAVSDLPGRNVEVVDTVGAGDAFTAALTLGLLGGQAIDKVNHKAIEAASLACAQLGGIGSR